MFDGIVLRDGSFELVDGPVPDWNEYFNIEGGAAGLLDELVGQGEGETCSVEQDEWSAAAKTEFCRRQGLQGVRQILVPVPQQS